MGSLRQRSSSQEVREENEGRDWSERVYLGVRRLFSSRCSSVQPKDRSTKQLVSSIECQPLKGCNGEPPRCVVVYTDFENRPTDFWQRNKCLLLTGLLATVSLVFLCTIWFTSVYNDTILKLVSIRNDINTVYDLWRLPPTSPTLTVYPFNYTNFAAVLEGKETPVVQEIGPFVFREKGEKVGIRFNDNSTVSFQERKNITYLPQKSNGNIEDFIYVPNVPLIVVLNSLLNLFYIEQKVFEAYLRNLNASPFLRVNVHDFIWGFEDSFFQGLVQIYKTFDKPIPKKYGFLAKRRGLHHDIVTMKTGADDLNLVGTITRWGGADRIGKWGNTSCDSIAGSDGSLYGAHSVQKGETLYVYSKQMCRRFPLKFNKTTTSKDGFPVQQYDIDENMFDFSGKNSDNVCFQYKGEYPPTGSFNTSPCQNESPIYVSFPHFWTGGEELRNSIKGLSPDPEKHSSRFHIHKDLGISLLVQTRFQLNIMLRKSSFITHTSKLPAERIILPIAWMEYNSGDLPEHFVNIVYHLTYTVRIVETTLKIIFLISTIALLVIVFVQFRKNVR